MRARLLPAAVLLSVVAACSGSGDSASPPGQAAATTSLPSPAGSSHASATPSQTSSSPPASGLPAGGPVPAHFEPASVSFVSAGVGYVLGTTPTCPSTPCTSLVRTTDGGRHWVGVPAPRTVLSFGPASMANPGVSRVRFADPLNGFAYGPSLYVTHDGARTWAPVAIPNRVLGLAISAGRVTLIEGPCSANSSCDGIVHLLSGSAGDSNFVPVAESSVAGTFGYQPLVLHGTAGYAVLGPGQLGPSRMDATADGRTWRPFPDPCSTVAGTSLADLAAPDTTYLFSLCIGQPAGGNAAKTVVVTRDGSTMRAGILDSGNNDATIAAASDQVLAAASYGVRGQLLRSTDAGRTWKLVSSPQDGGAPFIDLGFTTSTQGVVVHGQPTNGAAGAAATPDELLMTTDAGNSWHSVAF